MDSSKSGLSMENNVMSTKLKTANQQGPDGHTMDFQDGGQNRGNFLNAEANHVNPDGNNFNQMPGNPNMNSDSFGKMSENASGPPGSNYNPGFNRGNYVMSDQQHGNMNANNAEDLPQQHGQFSQFGQQNMRPGLPQMMRNNSMPGRSGMSSGNMGMMPSNFNNPQRMMSGPNMQQQQGGPTPTLNQLLTNSNTSQRYQGGGYNNYDMSQSKGSHDMSNSSGYNSQNWTGQSQQGSNPYQQQQMQGNQPFRNQGQMYDSQGRRPPGMGGGYPEGGQYGQYPANNQRYPMQQGYPQQMPYGQPGYNQSFMQQQQQVPGGPQQQMPAGSTPQQQPPTSQSQSLGPQQQPLPAPGTPNSQPPAQQPSPSPQQQNLSPQSNASSKQTNSQDGQNANSSGGPNGEDNNDVNACTTPTPTSQNSSSRAVPSPVGSAGSRSNTPASIPGNQAGSPMPPRPPSSHEGRIQSPMATQGFSQQQMMPPPMHGGATGQMGYPNKMGSHPNMMNNPGMGNQPYNNQYPNQGNFRGQPGMGGYAGQQGPYNGPMGNQMYPSNVPAQGGPMGMNRNMSGPNYPNSYQNNMNNQYGNYNGPSGMGPGTMGPGGPGNVGPNAQGGMVQGGPGPMPNMAPNNMGPNGPNTNMSSNGPNNTPTPPAPNPGPGGPQNMPNAMNNVTPPNVPPNIMAGAAQQTGTPKGAQAAAQAAMIAAANMATNSNRGMYGRQGDVGQQNSPNNQQHKTPGQSQGGFNQNQMGVDGVNNMGAGSGPPGYNANMPNLPNQDPMGNQMQGLGPNNIPPNAVAPGSVMGMSGQPGMNMGGQMGGQNPMGPPVMPPPSSMPTSTVAPNSSGQSNMPTAMSQPNTGASPAPSEATQQNEEPKPATTNSSDSSTTVNQSINLPVATNSTESNALDQRSGTPSQHSESSNQSQPGEITTNGPSSIVPGGEDSNSQDAITGKSRLQKQDSNSVAPSPSGNSMSSQHDEFENISSPSWPGTPKPAASEGGKPEGATTSAAAMKQYDMGEEMERKPFLDKLFVYLEDKGSPITAMPMISKNPIDLYKLYTIVKEKGGLLEVTKGKKWREISSALNIGSSGSAGFTLRKNYIKYLFNYECTFDRGNMDPAPVLAQVEQMSGKKERKSTASPGAGMMDPFRPPNNQGFDGGYGNQQRMGMNDMGPGQAGAMGPGAMMHPNSNMMQNPQMAYGSGGGMMPNNSMPPNTSVMPNNSMMPNSNMPNSQMNMPNNMNNMGMPNSSQNSMMATRPMSMPSSSSENVTVQDPFADNVQMNNSNQFQRPGAGSQVPPYNQGGVPQQQQPNMPNSGGYFNRQPGMGNSMGYNNQQQAMNNQQQGPYNSAMGPAAGPGNDPYRRGMAPGMMQQQPGQQQQQQTQQQQGPQPEGFNNQFNNRQNSMGPGGNSQQFPFGASADRFGQSSPAPPPNQPSPAPSTHSQPDQSSQQGPGSAQPLRPPSAASHTSSTASPAPPPPATDSGTSSPMPPSVPTQPPQQPTPTPSEGSEQPQQQPVQQQQPVPPSAQLNQMPPNSQVNAQMPPASMPMNSSSPLPANNQMTPTDQMTPSSQLAPTSSMSSMPNSQMSMMPNNQMSSMSNQMQPNQQMPGNQMGNQMPFNRYGNQGNQYQQSGMTPQGNMGQQSGMGPQSGMNQGYNQQRGYPQSSMSGQMGSNVPGYGQQNMGGYPGQKPMPQQYPQQKPYPGYGPRDGYNMPSGYQSGYGQQNQYGGYNQQRGPMGPQDSQAGMMNGPSMGPSDSMYGGVDPNMYGGSMSASGYPSYTDDYTDMRSGTNSGQTSPWTTAMQQRFSGSSPYTQNQQQMPPSGMSGHYGSMYNRMAQQRMSPQRPSFGTPQKQKPIAGSFQSKKDIVFPQGSVEATQPILQKRKRLTYKDVCPVDPWKIIMALKSGLMAESTWALDTLTILLFDDHTIPWFSLLHLPGLVEVLLEHFRQTLIQIFPGHFEDLEVQTERQKRSLAKRFKREQKVSVSSSSGEASDSDDENNEWEPAVFISPSKEALSCPGNYTMKTRKGSTVTFDEKDKDDEYVRDKKKWDKFAGFKSDSKHWQDGKGDLSCHILTKFHGEKTLEFYQKQFFGEENCKHIKNNNLVVIKQAELKKELLEEEDSKEGICDDSNTCEQVKSELDATESSEAQDVKCERSANNSPQPPSISKNESIPSNTDDSSKDSSVKENSDSACPSPPVLSSEVEIKKEPSDSISGSEEKSEIKMEVDGDSVKEEDGNLANAVKDKVKEEKAVVKIRSKDIKDSLVDPDLLKEISAEEVKVMEGIKRKWEGCEEENEAYQRDSSSMCLITDQQEELTKRCVCLSNIFRSLSFVPGNDRELSSHHGLMLTLGRLLLLKHKHPKRKREQRKFDREDPDIPIEDTIEDGLDEWWWDSVCALRENSLVIFANITGKMKLIDYPEDVSMSILEGLIHWAVCPSSQAQDPLPSMAAHAVLSPRRLVLEAMCKLSIKEYNVDLILATPPFTRIVQLLSILVDMLANRKEQVMREFSIVLLSALVSGDNSAARAVALLPPTISLLIDFLETAEQQAMTVANSHGVNMLRDNPEMMGTSLDMLRRAASMLLHMARVPENRTLFLHQQQRLLQLVMSHILDSQISGIIADILFHCSDQVNDETS